MATVIATSNSAGDSLRTTASARPPIAAGAAHGMAATRRPFRSPPTRMLGVYAPGRRGPVERLWHACRRAGRGLRRILLLGFMLLMLGGIALSGLAGAYMVKRALRIDVVPGVDMLPDDFIESYLGRLRS